jgi:hypothetical protein
MNELKLDIRKALASHLQSVFFGGNWTSVNLKETLQDVDWQQATNKVSGMNSIAVLVFHMGYYVREVLKVLRGAPLQAHDKYSFELPPLRSEEEWQRLVNETFEQASQFADAITAMPEGFLGADFSEPKYGTYYHNILGIIEHTHYHLGQIVMLKKMNAHSAS